MADPMSTHSDRTRPVVEDQEVLVFLTGSIDKSLPTPIGAQLREAIEYGIASQALTPGARLPSIRTLAQVTGLAAETVASAYRALQSSGILTSFRGSGTFVSEHRTNLQVDGAQRRALEKGVDGVLALAQDCNIPVADLITMVRLRHAHSPAQGAPLRITMIGIFADATKAYAQDIQHHLKPDDVVDAMTVDQLRENADQTVPDLYITLPSRQKEVLEIVGNTAAVTTLGMIPSEATRSFLASLDPNTTLALVAKFPGFMASMRQSTQAFAPHLRHFDSLAIDDPDIAERVSTSDVVVYSTGADAVLKLVAGGKVTAEFRHTPDPHELKDVLLPRLETIRRSK